MELQVLTLRQRSSANRWRLLFPPVKHSRGEALPSPGHNEDARHKYGTSGICSDPYCQRRTLVPDRSGTEAMGLTQVLACCLEAVSRPLHPRGRGGGESEPSSVAELGAKIAFQGGQCT